MQLDGAVGRGVIGQDQVGVQPALEAAHLGVGVGHRQWVDRQGQLDRVAARAVLGDCPDGDLGRPGLGSPGLPGYLARLAGVQVDGALRR